MWQIIVSKYPEWLFSTILIIVIEFFVCLIWTQSSTKLSINYPHNPRTILEQTRKQNTIPWYNTSSRDSFFFLTNQPKLFAPESTTCIHTRVRQFLLIALLTPLLLPSLPAARGKKRRKKWYNQSADTNYARARVRAKNYAPLFFSRSPKRSINATAPPLLPSSTSTTPGINGSRVTFV